MSYAESIELLKSAEAVLLTTISQSGNEGDYDSMHKCLDLAQRIRDLTLEVSALEKKTIITPASDTPSYPEENHPVASASASSLPAYYVSDKKLWKVANKTGGTGAVYKKSVPMDDVERICKKIIEALPSTGTVAVSTIEAGIPGMPVYKVQTAMLALVQARCLKNAGRGKYSLAESGSRSSRKWLEALQNLPVYVES